MSLERPIIPIIERPTPNARLLIKAALEDETADELFERACPVDGPVIPEEKFRFLSHVVETFGLSEFEANEVFSRKSMRRIND